MKNRRLALVAFLLCACMIVGVGYAAVIVNLDIQGTAAFHTGDVEDFKENVHFTGKAAIETAPDVYVDTTKADFVALNVKANEITATLDVNLVKGTHDSLIKGEGEDRKYEVTVYYEFEVVAEGAIGSKLDVNFDKIAVSGMVGANSAFNVTSAVCDSDKNELSEEDMAVTVTVAGEGEGQGKTAETFWLKVVVTLDADTNADITDTEFHVVLPVTKVEPTNA